MNRAQLFYAGIAVAVICVIVAVLYWVGAMPPDQKVHVKHGIVFLGIAVIAALFALANRPVRTLS